MRLRVRAHKVRLRCRASNATHGWVAVGGLCVVVLILYTVGGDDFVCCPAHTHTHVDIFANTFYFIWLAALLGCAFADCPAIRVAMRYIIFAPALEPT